MITTPRKVAIALLGAGAILLGVWSFRSRPRPTHPIDAVPADAFVAIEVNVGALRKAGALHDVFGDRDEQSLTEVCGFDPVDKMNDLVFTVPEGGDGTFGVAVEADLGKDELLACADKVIKGHGGDPTPEVVSRGSYDVVTPHSTSADSTKPSRSLAFREGSPILVGPRSWLFSMVDAVEDASEGRGSAGEHVTLRAGLAEGMTQAPTFLLTATVLLERSVREKLKAQMLTEVGPSNDSGSAMMLGVLGMSSGVLGLYEQGDDVRAVLNLRCEEPAQCMEVEKLIRKVRDDWSKIPALRAFGLGPVLDHLEVDQHGTKLQLRAAAPTKDVVGWARLLLASKPFVTAADGPVAAGAGGAGSAAEPDVPTQTIKIKVPDGVEPGQPFTVKIPTPSQSGSASPTHVRMMPVTVPSRSSGPASAASGAAAPAPQ